MGLIEIQNDVFRILIDTDKGTSISTFFVKKENAWLPIMPDSRNEDIDLQFASFLMMPYSNRIENGCFTFREKEYLLTNGDHHAIHGDVRFRPWQIEKMKETQIACRFNSKDHENVNWPWTFEASVEYILSDNLFTSRLTLWNRADSSMPAGMGWHPYFSRRLSKEKEPVHLCMKTDSVYPDENDNRIPSGTPLPLSEDQDFSVGKRLEPEAYLDACFYGYDGNGYILWPESGVKLTFDCSPDCSHLILFNPPQPYFAVEPVTNANNGVNLYAQGDPSSGIAVLEPGEKLTARFSMKVDSI